MPCDTVSNWFLCVLTKALEGFGVSEVIHSDHPNYKPGDLITGFTGWEEYSVIQRTEQLRKIQPDDRIPLSFHVGLLGMWLPSIFTIDLLAHASFVILFAIWIYTL